MKTDKKPVTRKRRSASIPDFSSREEEARYWDTHSVADHLDELEPVKVKFAKNLSEGITVRFDPQTLAKLRSQAQQKGVGPTTLIRMWVLEHLQADRAGALRE